MHPTKKNLVKKISSVLALSIFSLAILSGCGDNGNNAADNSLSIPLENLTNEPTFVDWEQDGQAMQLIALRDGDGARLAYNTCQSCAGSPYAYFEYKDGVLQCQNCGFTFDLDSIGAVTGGCNPKPVGDYQIDGSAVTVDVSELKSAVSDFKSWKNF